ncbi:hypothetical protein [Shewanella sp.]|uniref:hypothetical protein n=1 Tax=Shewanella sp. TaxID=50422 RepID=UPI004048B1B9
MGMKRKLSNESSVGITKRRKQNPPAPAVNMALVKREIATAISRNNIKSHPVRYVDIYLTGDDVTTSPSVHSLTQKIIDDIQAYYLDDLQVRKTGESSSNTYNYGKAKITNVHYQLRYQQDEDVSSGADLTNTIRVLAYNFQKDTATSNSGILDGGDVDRPPDYQDVKRMHLDDVFTMHGYQLNTDTTPDTFIPGTHIIKGDLKVNQTYEVKNSSVGGSDMKTEDHSMYFEWQSDSSGAPHPNVYGYIRTFYRLIE